MSIRPASEASKAADLVSRSAESILNELDAFISAAANNGRRSVTNQYPVKTVTLETLDQVKSILIENGYQVKLTPRTDLYTIEVSFN
ncbi:hypothetical protein [Acinetobacter baumannii]|uniref:hypothetical protein n=1 Tax=Acinetobacter baumannii TaxID=470 RepID=UPI0039893978